MCIVEDRLDGSSAGGPNAREVRWWSGHAADEQLSHDISDDSQVVRVFEHAVDFHDERGDGIVDVLVAGVM